VGLEEVYASATARAEKELAEKKEKETATKNDESSPLNASTFGERAEGGGGGGHALGEKAEIAERVETDEERLNLTEGPFAGAGLAAALARFFFFLLLPPHLPATAVLLLQSSLAQVLLLRTHAFSSFFFFIPPLAQPFVLYCNLEGLLLVRKDLLI
jgi:hypothetical protein